MTNKILKTALWVTLLCLMLFNPSALAVTLKEVPNPRVTSGEWVTDMANLLTPETESQLNQIISDYEQKTGTEIAVVTVPNTAPHLTPKIFATRLFKSWGIGKSGIDNGILFLVSEAERRVEIRTGCGIEPLLPNTKVKEIIQITIIPLFKEGAFSEGTLLGTQALIQALIQANTSVVHNAATKSHPEVIFFALLGVAVTVISFAIAAALRPLLLAPEGKSRVDETPKNEAAKCSECGQWMKKLDSESLISYLSEPEQVAQRIGSLYFDGWQCPKCHLHLTGNRIHMRAYILDPEKFTSCPTCQELTVERTVQILQFANRTQDGQNLITEKCHCCSYFQETTQPVPRVVWDSSISADGGWGDSSSFGGDCGGGGDGGGW